MMWSSNGHILSDTYLIASLTIAKLGPSSSGVINLKGKMECPFIESNAMHDWSTRRMALCWGILGFPFILLGILRMKRKKKKEKKEKEGGLVSSWHPLNSLPQAFAKKFSCVLKCAEIADSKAQHGIFVCTSKYTVLKFKSEFHKLVSYKFPSQLCRKLWGTY